MLISDLQDRLRAQVRERILAGEITGTELAHRAGFQQAHISNFLNERRGLSIEAMDRLMEVLGLQVKDLMPQTRGAVKAAREDAGYEPVPLVDPHALLKREFNADEIREYQQF